MNKLFFPQIAEQTIFFQYLLNLFESDLCYVNILIIRKQISRKRVNNLHLNLVWKPKNNPTWKPLKRLHL